MLSIFLLATCLVGSDGKNQALAVVAQHTIPKESIKVTFEKLDKELKNKEGIPMLQVQGNSPIVTIENNKKATKRINNLFENKKKAFEVQEAIDFKQAQSDYVQRTEEEKKYWNGYGLGLSYIPKRMVEKVISFVEDQHEYTGGAHPNSLSYAETFDTKTGQLLTLKDITTNEKEARNFINEQILKQTKDAQYKDYFFEGYEKDIKDILTDQTWYLSDKGIVVICNEYIISPHAVGILEFTIPYERDRKSVV